TFLSLFFFFYCCRNLRHLHSFPTRRSSDLFPALARCLSAFAADRRQSALPLAGSAFLSWQRQKRRHPVSPPPRSSSVSAAPRRRSEEHTSELQSRGHLVCRLLLEKKKTNLY